MVQIPERRLDDFGMNQLRVDPEDPALFEGVPHAGSSEALVEFRDRGGRRDRDAMLLTLVLVERSSDRVDVGKARFDQIKNFVNGHPSLFSATPLYPWAE